MSNDERGVDSIKVDFGDGQGWKTVQFDEAVLVEYDTAGMYEVKCKVYLSDLTTLSSSFIIERHPNGAFKDAEGNWHFCDEWLLVQSSGNYQGAPGKAYISINYAKCNPDHKIRRPFIVAGGFHTPISLTGASKFYGPIIGDNFWSKVGKQDVFNSNTIVPEVLKQEYDLIFIDFYDPTDYIQRNALVFEDIIKWVNHEKEANGSHTQNVVFGNSLGGIISRYALGDMHKQHLDHDSADHDTRLLITHDSPHRGANASLGIQAFIKAMHKYYFVYNQNVPVVETSDVYWDYQTLIAKSVEQMVINYIKPSSLHQELYDSLDIMAGVDNLGCKFVAICDGSGSGVQQGKKTGTSGGITYMAPSDLILSYDAAYVSTDGKVIPGLVFNIWVQPVDTSPHKKVFEGAIVNKLAGTIIYPYYSQSIAPATMWNGLDCKPGSAGPPAAIAGGNMISALRNSLPTVVKKGGIQTHFPNICFIPTISSCAVNSNVIDYNLIVNTTPGNNEVKAKRFITYDYEPPIPSERNGAHAYFTPYTVKIFENEMLNTAPATIPSGKTYNYGAPVSDWIGDVTVNGTLAINKNVKAGYTDDNFNNSEPPEGSTFFVETFVHDNNCTSDPVTITVNGELQLGDAGTDHHAGLTINSGSRLILNPGSSLKIYKNSKLTIKHGATLELNGGTILLQDDGSNLEMGGYLELDNYDLTFSGSGFITIISQSSGYASISKTGSCSLQLEGSSKTDLVLRVIGGGINASGFNQVELKNGLVEMGADAEIKTSSSTHLESVKFAPLPWATSDKYKGITFDGQNGSSLTVKFCEFGKAKIALNKLSSADVTLLEIRGCKFTDCEKAIVTEGYRAYLNNNQFTNCDYAWYATEMEGLSQFKGRILGSSQKGIYYSGGNNAHLLIEQSLFSENGSAVEVFGALQATISCSEFEDNNASVLANDGVTLNLSTGTNGSNAAGTSTVAGGNNRFTNVADYDIGLSDAFDLLTLDGNNTFLYPNYSSSPASYSIGGNVTNSSYHALHLTSNYWYFYGYSPTYSIPSGMYSLYFGVTLVGTIGSERSTSISYSCGAITETDVNSEVFYGKREEPNSNQRIIENKEYRIYPNPAKQIVNISSDFITKESQGKFDIKAVDITGRIIELHTIKQEGLNTISCEISQLTPGVYMLVIFKDGILVQKRKLIIKG